MKKLSRFAHFATGQSGFPDAHRRGQELAEGLRQMASECGTKFKGALGIRSDGDIELFCEDGHTYGERLAEFIRKHGARAGAQRYGYTMHTHAADRWCFMNHFSVQAMLEDYFTEIP